MTFTIAINKNGSNIISNVGSNLSLRYGRQDSTSTCQPMQLSFGIVHSGGTTGTIDPNTILLGDRITITITNTSYAGQTYFTGTITDIKTGHYVSDIVAVSDGLSGVNRTPVTLGAQTTQSTGTVVNAALTAIQTAGALPGKSITTSTGTNTVTTPVQTSASSQTFIGQVVASEPSGVLLEDGALTIRFSDYSDRRVATMPAAQKFDFSALGSVIDWNWTLEKSVSDYLNRAEVTWTGGISTYADSASVAANGAYTRAVTTYIDNQPQADYSALRLVQHGLKPGWRTSGIAIDMAKLSDANRQAVLVNMRTGSYLKIPSLLSGTQTEFFVEGWTDTFVYGGTGTRQWSRLLYVSDIVITAAAQRYVDVTSGVTYATVNGALRWIDLEQTTI